jgi:hypothetical protein
MRLGQIDCAAGVTETTLERNPKWMPLINERVEAEA